MIRYTDTDTEMNSEANGLDVEADWVNDHLTLTGGEVVEESLSITSR